METKQLAERMRAFDVWKRTESPTGVVRYRCFEDLVTGKFCVQSSDFYPNPLTQQVVFELEKQYLELLIEQSPFERSGAFISIEAAIEDHDLLFKE